MYIFDRERKDNLEEVLNGQKSIAFASEVRVRDLVTPEDKRAIAKLFANATNQNQLDLHYLDTILVSTGWNKNYHVFAHDELWKARHSPEDKPFNYNHDEKDIIGHIT